MDKIYKVDIIEQDNVIYLRFHLGSDSEYMIDFSSEDQTKIRKIFYKIVELCYEHKPILELHKESDFSGKQVYVEISEIYIKDLNKEIEKVYDEIQSEKVR